MRPWVRILGIDPGSRVTGYGVLETNGQESRHIDSGVIKTARAADSIGRLEIIYNEMRAVIARTNPHEIAIERVFVHRNADSALKLGQARAAALCANFGSAVPVSEYAARQVKQAIVGKGGADKEQVAHMVRVLLNLAGNPRNDESDALAIALCHAHTRGARQQISEAIA